MAQKWQKEDTLIGQKDQRDLEPLSPLGATLVGDSVHPLHTAVEEVFALPCSLLALCTSIGCPNAHINFLISKKEGHQW